MVSVYWVKWRAYRIQDLCLRAEDLLSRMCGKCEKIRKTGTKDKDCLDCPVERAIEILKDIYSKATEQLEILRQIKK
ncbi:MAG: hypothetical protein Q6363_004270 [Candidatus Njordarchaeota archaeon]